MAKDVLKKVHSAMKMYTPKDQFLNLYIKPQCKYGKISNRNEAAAPDMH